MTPEELATYVRAAAELRRLLLPRRRDRTLTAREGTVLHAIDTDIVVLYCRPWEKAPHTDRRKEGYAEVFPGENREIVIGLGIALAELIFHRLSEQLPLMMLPPMGEEVNDVVAAIARDASRENDKVFVHLDKMRQLVKETAGLDSPAQAAGMLAAHADEIARFLRGREGPTAELRRFAQLLRSTRIAPPEYLLEKRMIQDPILSRALEPPTDLVDRIAFRALRENWFDRLRKTKSPTHQAVLTDADAQALARLEWINQKLTPLESGAKPKYRLVLITGDHAIHGAGALVHSWGHSRQSFGELFLRHPKAYLGEPNVLDPPDDIEAIGSSSALDTQFDQWLDTWLSELNPGTDDFERDLDSLIAKSDKALAEWVKPLIETRPQVIDRFQSTWREYTRNLVVDRGPSELEVRLASIAERGVLDEYERLISDLSQAIDGRVRDTWEHCFSVAAEGSYSLLRARAQEEDSLVPSRNPPLLTFDRFNATRAFVTKVLNSYEAGGLTAEQWDDALEELSEDDKSGYAFFVALGLLFAADGIWRVSGILADRALSIAMRQHPDKISGREAAYLRAVALRHSSRHAGDLEPISSLLDRAKAAYAVDLQGYPPLRAGPCRFDAERWALFLTYHLYRVLLAQQIPDAVPALGDIQTGIDRMLAQLPSSQERENAKDYTERNLVVNWIMASLLMLKDEGRSPDVDLLAAHHNRLVRNIERAGNDLRPSYYVEAIRLVCAVLIARDGPAIGARRSEARKWLDGRRAAGHNVMRYDAERFLLLREIVEGKVS